MSSELTSILGALGKVLISVWVIYQIFKQERTLEPTVRIVRWSIVLTGVGGFFLFLVYFPHVSVFVLIGLITFPAGLVFLFPELAVYIVRGYRAIRNHPDARSE